ncbi:hypothetical protein ABFS82_13G102600 [Erythranthe guttata]|uniref:Homeobox-leucine zipper protein n=1 Tax=Erythranthe guttata TaxID=4155 RepID=A0A022QNI5_ERYGU|nr:PREDICTED: homeobox-leucine zipper protein ATHB-52-like [Erythranthe guttata]EYU28020.1 hypothetical protein MIMGU_mgv1a015245mg [Erythranthe guttata]|eukprot:XP_012848650.1 PREDICTED: homeobox-leucine zipper protein ATHB-52-like [Erythranthe guttata]
MEELFQYTETQKHQTITKSRKKRLTENQVRLLESNFSSNNKLEPDRKCQLAAELGVPPRQVSIWYQNKRARDKAQSLEIDHGNLQLRLESVLADNARLKGQVAMLKDELNRIQSAFVTPFNNIDVVDHKHDLEGWLINDSLVGGGAPFVAPPGMDMVSDLVRR